MVLCYFCNIKAEKKCNECDMPICKNHSLVVEKVSSGVTEQALYCPKCAEKISK